MAVVITLHGSIPPRSMALIIPPKKTKSIPKIHIKYDNNTILLQDCVKYLSIVFDSRLTFVQLIQLFEEKISRSMGIMYKLKIYYRPDH